MGMFKQFSKPPRGFDRETANRLLKCIQTHKRLTGWVNLSTWAKQIKLLRTLDGFSRHSILGMIKWLEVHLTDEFVPLVLSARSFRQKFPQLLLAKERQQPKKVRLSPRAKKLEHRLATLHWPKGSQKLLGQLIEETFLSTEQTCRRLRLLQFALDGPEFNTVKRLAVRVIQELGSHQFVETWWRNVNQQLSSWEGWSGNTKTFEFNLKNERVNKLGREVAHQYCQDGGQWDRLLQLLEEHIA